MIRYTGHYITFQEVPNMVSLVLTISGCQRNCVGCHSPWLRDPDMGCDLEEMLPGLLDRYGDGINCVCFMGEGRDSYAFERCVKMVQKRKLKTCLYSGADSLDELPSIVKSMHFIKLGHYEAALGGLNSPTTNQRMYKNFGAYCRPYKYDLVDVTKSWFQREYKEL